jgi:zinc protease
MNRRSIEGQSKSLLGRALRVSALSLVAAGVIAGGCAGKQKTDAAEVRTPPDEPWRKERPASGESPDVKLPVFERETLKNGLQIYVIREAALPLVDVRLMVRAGSQLDGAKEAGLATLAWDMLDEGAGKMDALALADAVAALGTSVNIANGREAGSLSMALLKRNLEPGLELLATMAQKPSFKQDDFERVLKRHESTLKGRAGNPRAIAQDVFAATSYGTKHPYGGLGVGTAQTVAKLNARKAKSFWSKHAGPKTSALVFAGDITLEEAKTLAKKHFGKWRGRAKPPKAPKDPTSHEVTRLHLVNVPNTPQTVVLVGRPLAKHGDEDEWGLQVLNQMLGGMFSSRLNLNLREDKGWTYGAWSFVDRRAGMGPFGASAGIKAEHTADALSEFFKEFDGLLEGPKDDAELNAAKDNYVKSLPGRFETVSSMGAAGGELFLYDLPLDYYAQLPEQIKAVTAEDVKNAAQRALPKEKLNVILVGDKSVISGSVEALGVADIVEVTHTGEPVPAGDDS